MGGGGERWKDRRWRTAAARVAVNQEWVALGLIDTRFTSWRIALVDGC
ncbi:hypothetical protein [Streptomyces mashuensis]|nr:hypothetical protein [Streptomyces mashuensis]